MVLGNHMHMMEWVSLIVMTVMKKVVMKKIVVMLVMKLLIKPSINVQICLELNMINQLLFPGKVPSDQDVADLDSMSSAILRISSTDPVAMILP